MKVWFQSPGKAGRPLRGGRARKFEAEGFDASEAVEEAATLAEADLIYARYIPEDTTDALRDVLCAELAPFAHVPVLNHPRELYRHDSKERSFEAWRAADVPTPGFRACDDEGDALAFARAHPRLLLRINDEACGDDTALLDAPDERTLRRAFARIAKRVRKRRRAGRGDARVVAVEQVGARDEFGLARTFRAFVAGDELIGGYALVSPDDIIHSANAACGDGREAESFLRANDELQQLCAEPSFAALARRALDAVGLDVACLDFVMEGQEVRMLEANALWSPSHAWVGGQAGRALFEAAEADWRRRARLYCEWMDRAAFYRRLYDLFPRLALRARPDSAND